MSAQPDLGRSPVTDRGRRTRAGLVSAARGVFEEKGFAATRMGDVAQAAGVSHGTVYTYFETKDELLTATIQQIVDAIRESMRTPDGTDPIQRAWVANRRYLDAYTANAELMRVIEEASSADPKFAVILEDLRRTHTERVSEHISRMQATGLVAADLDPDDTALALCAMVEGYARNWTNRVVADLPGAAESLTRLWANALGLSAETLQAGFENSNATQHDVSKPAAPAESVSAPVSLEGSR
ncbi:MAG: TetR/AcrR family transcriptional regulator [Actinomycetia bacterium]|nr:TetR/AcrR family transcriptional regulator [Actinomycetes bacterium]